MDGNRTILFWVRERHDWLDRPFRKVTLLLAATAIFSSATAFLVMLAWFAVDGTPGIDWPGLWLNLVVTALRHMVRSGGNGRARPVRDGHEPFAPALAAQDEIGAVGGERARSGSEISSVARRPDP